MTSKNVSFILCFTALFFIWTQDGVYGADSKKKSSNPNGDLKLYKKVMGKIREIEAKFSILRSDLGKLDVSKRMSRDERSALREEIGAMVSGIDAEYREAKKETTLSKMQSKSIEVRLKELKESAEAGDPVRLGEETNGETVRTLGGVIDGVKTLGGVSMEKNEESSVSKKEKAKEKKGMESEKKIHGETLVTNEDQ